MQIGKRRIDMPLYKCAGLGALCACALWPLAVVLQCAFIAELLGVSFGEGRQFVETLKTLFESLTETDMPLAYDLPHLSGTFLLVPFLAIFAFVCFKTTDHRAIKRRSCLLIGIGLECYALMSFLFHLVMAVILYYREWSMGVSHSVIFRVLFTAFGSGFAELSIISLFALALLITGYTGRVRPFAVSIGAICFYRLFEDSLWLATGAFDSTLFAASFFQVAHGIVFLAASSLTFGAAVLVSMSSPEEEEQEETVCD